MLTRVYGLAFESKEKLDAYIYQQEEAKKRDHRKLAKELKLLPYQNLLVQDFLSGNQMAMYSDESSLTISGTYTRIVDINGYGHHTLQKKRFMMHLVILVTTWMICLVCLEVLQKKILCKTNELPTPHANLCIRTMELSRYACAIF